MIEKITYSELLKDPRWQKKRLEIMNRDKFTCKLCGDTETTLHVHHKKYKFNKNPWEYSNTNFITVCEDCHVLIGTAKRDGLDITKYRLLKIADKDKSPNVYYYYPGKTTKLVFLAFNGAKELFFTLGIGPISFNKIYDFMTKIKNNG